jgi:hypothetical protein
MPEQYMCNYSAVQFHPLASIFPLMEGAEFDALVADIKEHGLCQPVVTLDGLVLDGRNRLLACLKADIAPRFVNGDDWITDPAAYVISINIRRRHLTSKQREELFIKIIALAPEKSDRQIAASIGVDHKTVGAARAKGEELGSVPQLKKTVGKDGKSRPPKRKKSTGADVSADKSACNEPGAAAFAELVVSGGEAQREIGAQNPGEIDTGLQNPITRAWSKATRRQHDEFARRYRGVINGMAGSQSSGELARLQARIDELENERRRLELKIVGLESEVADLRVERLAKSKAALAEGKRSEELTHALRAVVMAESPRTRHKALERLGDKLKERTARYLKVTDSTPEHVPAVTAPATAAGTTSMAKPSGPEAAPTEAPKITIVH